MKSGLRPSRSLGDLESRRAFDVRVGYGRKRIPPLGSVEPVPKALVVTVYRNGDSYYPGCKVSIRPGKDFLSVPKLCDFLSQRIKIPQGVRYLYDLDGGIITDLRQLKDGGSYVASGVKTFQKETYGKLARLKTGPVTHNAAPLRPDDLKLLRPLSPRKPLKTSCTRTFAPEEVTSLPGSRESCVVTVVNKRDPSRRSRVLLNLKTRQTWEDVLRDMGYAVNLRGASRMLTPWGEEVGSFSQLKNDFAEVETFYLDIAPGKRHRLNRASSSEPRLNDNTSSLRIRIPDLLRPT